MAEKAVVLMQHIRSSFHGIGVYWNFKMNSELKIPCFKQIGVYKKLTSNHSQLHPILEIQAT